MTTAVFKRPRQGRKGRLPDADADARVLRLWNDGYAISEIARFEGKSASSISIRLNRLWRDAKGDGDGASC